MAVFRVQKTRDYTVMTNHHLRNKALSLKAKGLLSLISSLPDDWNYSIRGLASICKEGVNSISAAINELERAGYIVRNRLRDEKGRIKDTEYMIYEQLIEKAEEAETSGVDQASQDDLPPDAPHTAAPDNDVPSTVQPCTEKPYMDSSHTEMPA